MTAVTSGAGHAYSSRAPAFTTSFNWVPCYSIFRFLCSDCNLYCLYMLLYMFIQNYTSVLINDTITAIFELCRSIWDWTKNQIYRKWRYILYMYLYVKI